MAILVKLWGVYDAMTAEGMLGVDEIFGDSGGNGTSLFKRTFGIGLSRLFE